MLATDLQDGFANVRNNNNGHHLESPSVSRLALDGRANAPYGAW
jgi:hypothetical protein